MAEGRRERKKAQTRRSISDAATRMFLARGFDAVTVKEIADAADVSPTTVFTHFPTKEALVFDEDPELHARIVATVRERPPGQSVLDALEGFLTQGRPFHEPDEPGLAAFVELVASTPALRDYERRMLAGHEAALAEAIRETTDHDGLAARALARFVLGAVDLARDEPDHRAALARILAMLRSGWV